MLFFQTSSLWRGVHYWLSELSINARRKFTDIVIGMRRALCYMRYSTLQNRPYEEGLSSKKRMGKTNEELWKRA